MNREKILGYLLNNMDSEEFYTRLLEEMDQAKNEISVARSMFNNVSDDMLIEVAIYSENVARKRYDYLLSIARERGLKVGYDYILEKGLKAAD